MQTTKCVANTIAVKTIERLPHPSFDQAQQWLADARQEYLKTKMAYQCAESTLKHALRQVQKLATSYHD